jgi:hypothetical protein
MTGKDRGERRADIFGCSLKPQICDETAKRVAGSGELPDVDIAVTGQRCGFLSLCPGRERGSTAGDDVLSGGRIAAEMFTKRFEQVAIPASLARATVNTGK